MQEMPEIFEDGEFDDIEFVQQHIPEFRSDQNRLDYLNLKVRARTTHALVPTEIKVEDDDPAEILANPNVTTILPPISDGRIYVPLPDFDEIKPEIKPEIKEEFVIPPPINIAPTAMAITPDQSENDSDIDFKIEVKKKKEMDFISSTVPIPIEIDENKIVLTDDGDVILTEPDNMNVEYKPIIPYSEGVVQLPPEVEMEEVKTKNLVLKRKIPKNEIVNIKKIKNDTEVTVRDVKPLVEELGPMHSVDVNTMRMLPWIDFNTIIRETEVDKRTQVILNLLQNNLPDSAEDIYYIYHHEETNTFSIEVVEKSEEIQDFAESILVIDAKLRNEDLSDQKRKELKRKSRLKIKESEKTYGSRTLARTLKEKLTEEQKKEAEENIIQLQNELNKDDDKYYYDYNEDNEEYKLRLDRGGDVIRKIVAAILRTDKLMSESTSRSERRSLQKVRGALILYLRRIQANTLADALE